MQNIAEKMYILDERNIIYRTKGHTHGPITRLVSPGDLGELIKPFIFLDMVDMDASQKGPFGYHPHSGIATVTTIFEGDITYEDSTGKAGVLTAGTVEWMLAGGGVWHTGSHVPKSESRIKGFQLWLALPASLENTPPESLYIEADKIPKTGPVRVIIGEYQGARSPVPPIAPITYLHVHLKDGEFWTFYPPANHDVLWIAINQGTIDIAGETLASEIAIFDAKSAPLTLQAHGEVNFVLGSATQHPHALVTGAYSVHTSEEALKIGEQGIQVVRKRLQAEGRL